MYPIKPISFSSQVVTYRLPNRPIPGRRHASYLTNPHQDTVRFSAYPLKGFKREDIRVIREMMIPYRYGKDLARMLEPESRVRAVLYKDRVIIRNFGYPNLAEQTIRYGICQELAWDLQKRLKARFGDQYHFEQVEGNAATYFVKPPSTHFYLLGWTPAHDKSVREALANHPGEIPADALVFDPSFGLAVGGKEVQAYRVRELEEAHETDYASPDIEKIDVFPILDAASPTPAPLGFLSNLDHTFKPGKNKADPLVFIAFTRHPETGGPRLRLAKMDKTQMFASFWDTWPQEVDPSSLLSRFVNKIHRDLKTPDPELSALLDEELTPEVLAIPSHFYF